ncbi:MAG: UPF0182 family protein [Thermaerobacter sp.]|nr:UPF0182 family protein [Thermaerobacter sp.]
MSVRTRLWIVAVIIIAYSAVIFFAKLGLSLVWYDSIAHGSVFWVIHGVPVLLFAAAFVLATLTAFFALRPLQRALVDRGRPWVSFGGQEGGVVPEILRTPWLLGRPVAWILALLIGANAGNAVASDWQTYLLAFSGGAFGRLDPLFHLDAGFYVFRLPALFAAVDTILAIVVFIALARGLILLGRRYDTSIYIEALRRPAGLFITLLGILVWFSRYLAVSQNSVVNQSTNQTIVAGADYLAVHWTLPLQALVAVILVVSGILTVLPWIRNQTFHLRAAVFGTLGSLAIWIVGGAFGALVIGNQLSRAQQTWERPYMASTIAGTRYGFGISGVNSTPYPGNAQITAAEVSADSATISNVRLADPHAFQLVFSQLQTFRQYFSFPFSDVTVDRYYSGGSPHEVMLGAREVDAAYSGAGTQQSLLQYTHGYGVIAAGVTQFDSAGLPKLLIKNMPVEDHLAGTHISAPRIYYGEQTTDSVIAPNALGEFDYPTGQSSALSNYKGPGIAFNQNRLLIALSQGIGYLWQGQTVAASKFLMHRQIFDRVKRIAPWITLDPKANLVITNQGTLVWLMDGYTSSQDFPYSQLESTVAGTVNYLRNSVKITVSASTGAVHIYAIGKDPIRNAWARIFPNLVQPLSQMPADIRAHLQYPDGLFRTQAQVIARYHVSNLDTFYAGNDNWALPQELYQNGGSPVPMPSEQIIAKLPGASSVQYMRVLPFVPPGRPNMVGWLAALEDGSSYGKLVLYNLSSGSLIPGPMQVESEISQNPQISANLTLWDQHGSQVIRGDLLEIPIGGGMLAVEPIYLESSTNAVPELREVVVAYNNQVVMQPTLKGAINQLFGSGADTGSTAGASSPGKGTTKGGTGTSSAALSALISQIEQQNALVQKDMQAGNWAQLGQDEQKLQQYLSQLQGYAK